MNHLNKENWLELQLKRYRDFVPFCPIDNLMQLILEIQIIILQIEKIRRMEEDEKREQIFIQYEEKQSKINF